MKRIRLPVVLGLALLTSPRIGAQGTVKAPFARDELLVRFTGGASAAVTNSALAQFGARLVERYELVNDLYLVRLSGDLEVTTAVARLQAQPGVLYAEPNYRWNALATPNDPQFSNLWALHNTGQSGGTPDADIDAPETWNITTGSSSVVVAVIDTGIDYNHPDLAANVFRNEADCNANGVDDDANGYIDDCHGIDTVNDDSDPFDDNDHGTHVSGTIGAVGNNGIGVAGVNWNVKVIACKFLDEGGGGSTADAISCLNYLAMMKDRGVNIVASNNSWGGGGFSQALLDAIDAHRQRGILFMAAAGNAAADNDSNDFYPANYYLPNIVSVAATTSTDDLAGFSDIGRTTVHVAAPGDEILSTTPNNTYQSFSGTSMATPHVTGLAALIKAQDPSRDWRAIRNLLLAGGDNKPALVGTSVTEKRLNAVGSLTCANKVVRSRLRPTGSAVLASLGQGLTLAVLHINCAQPNGAVSVDVDGSGPSTTLLDNGVAPDQEAGDGVYSAGVTFSSYGLHTLTFPGGEVVSVQVLRNYTYQTASFAYRNFTGTTLELWDDSSAQVTSPFPIRFGGGSFNTLHVGSNGVLGLSAPLLDFVNVPIPMTSNRAFLAAFWDDLFPTFPTPGSDRNIFWTVLGTSPTRELVVEWRNLPHYLCQADPSATVKFQVVFFEGSSRVLVNYADTIMGGACASSDRGGSATIGVQVAPGTGTQRSFNTAVIESNTSLLWTTNSPFTDQSLGGVVVKAIHILVLRERIDSARVARGLSPFNWTDLSLTAGNSFIRAVHIQELRTALDAAYAAAGWAAPTYTDPSLVVGSTSIKAVHLTELRNAVAALE